MSIKIQDIYDEMKERISKSLEEISDPDLIYKISREIDHAQKNESNPNPVRLNFDEKELMERYRTNLGSSGKSKLTITDYCREAEKFIKFLKEKDLSIVDLKNEILEEYLFIRKQGKKKEISNNSYRKIIFGLGSFLGYSNKAGFTNLKLDQIQIPRKVKPAEKQILTGQEIEQVFCYINTRKEKFRGENLRDQVTVKLQLKCGLRKSEVIKLNWEDIDFKRNRINIINSKGGKSRWVPFGMETKSTMLAYRKRFGYYKGAVVRGKFKKRITSTALQNLNRRILVESGVYFRGLSGHSYRHTYCTMASKKYGTAVAQKLLGHSRLDTTEVYIHISDEDIEKAVID